MDYKYTRLVETSVMEQKPAENENNQNWFQQFLDDYDYSQPQRGQILEGEILRIDEDAVVVDIGLKRDGIVPARDLSMLDAAMRENLTVGNRVIVVVLQTPSEDQELLVSIHKGLEQLDWQRALTMLNEQTVVDLEVVAHNKGGLLVQFGSLRGFVPASQVPELRRIKDPHRVYRVKQGLVGQRIEVKAIEVDKEPKRLVFSALAAEEERRKKRLRELEKGQIIVQARVVSLVDFGVFVDLDGVDGLIHISELDWQKVQHPSELLKPGDEIDIKILDVDVENERVSLSRKALLPNPLEELREKYKPSDVVVGKVTNILDFGAFVELAEGVVGLVHVSELGYSASGKPQELVKIGEKVLVRILEIEPGKGRIALSMRRVPKEEQIAWLAGYVEGESESIPEAGDVVSMDKTEEAGDEGAAENREEILPEHPE
ncbi:MAG TPA: S1 RNA-binding domain-containing protein [Anaerolineales bacterium]|nr:S1 RNA-binding domain-containing protein [Anaerolineales bacterium]